MVGPRARDEPASADGSLAPHLIAGLASGALTSAALHPLDLIKIRYHVRDVRHLPPFASFLAAIRAIHADFGGRWSAWYAGTVPGATGAALSWSSYFYLYERIKREMLASQRRSRIGELDATGVVPPPRLGMVEHALAGWAASFITAFINVPFFLVKTRMELEGGGSAQWKHRAAGGAAEAAAPAISTSGAAAAPLRPYATMRGACEHDIAYRTLRPRAGCRMTTLHGALAWPTVL